MNNNSMGQLMEEIPSVILKNAFKPLVICSLINFVLGSVTILISLIAWMSNDDRYSRAYDFGTFSVVFIIAFVLFSNSANMMMLGALSKVIYRQFFYKQEEN